MAQGTDEVMRLLQGQKGKTDKDMNRRNFFTSLFAPAVSATPPPSKWKELLLHQQIANQMAKQAQALADAEFCHRIRRKI